MSVQEINSVAEFDSVSTSAKVIFVAVYTTGCSACQSIAPAFQMLAQENPSTGFYSVDATELPDISERLRATSFPTFCAIKNKVTIGKLSGANTQRLRTFVDTYFNA